MSRSLSSNARSLHTRLRQKQFNGGECTVPGCSRTADSGSEPTLGRFCRVHLEHHRRHGNAWRGSYRARDLNPYRRAAWEWLKAHPEDPATIYAIASVEALYGSAGRTIDARRLARRPADIKAKAVWARLREAFADKRLVLAAAIGVALRIDADRARPSASAADAVPSSKEFRDVQIAKVVLRMAGGSVRRWPARTEEGAPIVLRSFIASEGTLLRLLGDEAARAARPVLEEHGRELAAFAEAFIEARAGRPIAPHPGTVRTKPKARVPEELKAKRKAGVRPASSPHTTGGTSQPTIFRLGPDGRFVRS